jgi:O-antigen/teichoic acid export membrane protein
VERAAPAAAGLAAVLVVLTLAASGPLRNELFDGSWTLLFCFAGALAAYSAVHLTRGVLSGVGRFTGYGLLMAAEGVIRFVGCFVLAAAGVDTPGPYGIVLAASAAMAVVVVLLVERNLLGPGPPASFAELATALGHLLAGSVMAQVLLNGPPLAVKLLAEKHEQAVAGRFLAGLIVARIPVFLSAAVQAALLPRLSGLVAAGRAAEFRASLVRLLLVVVAVSSLGVLGSAAVGRPVVRLLFGPGFTLRSIDLAILAAASGVYLLALVVGQGIIAVGAQARVTVGWAAGVVAFVGAVLVDGPLVTRVEVAFLVGSTVSAVVMAGLLIPRLPTAGEQRGPVFDSPIVIDPLEP